MINEGSIKSFTHSPGIFQKEFNKERPAMLEVQNILEKFSFWGSLHE